MKGLGSQKRVEVLMPGMNEKEVGFVKTRASIPRTKLFAYSTWLETLLGLEVERLTQTIYFRQKFTQKTHLYVMIRNCFA